MFAALYHALFYDPVYNGLVFLIAIVPGGDAGIAVILLTILVRLLLFPLSLKATRTQLLMRRLEPELKRLREELKGKKEEQARRVMTLYREQGVNPLSMFLFMVVQILFIFALYFIFWKGGLPDIRANLLYAFTPAPERVSMLFLGFIDMLDPAPLVLAVLAALAGGTQFFQTRLSLPPAAPATPGARPSLKEDLARSFNLQMRYLLPLVIVVVAYTVGTAVALYFTVRNMVSIGQELYVRRTLKRPAQLPAGDHAGN